MMNAKATCVLAVLSLSLLGACSSSEPSTNSPIGTDGGTDTAKPPPGPTIGAVQGGTATYYDADGSGNCSFDKSPSDLDVAAMDAPEWANSELCGACVKVDGPKGSVTVRIVDQCPGCEKGHLDLSESAFAKIANPSDGRVKIQWQLVTCGTTGPLSYRFKEGSSQWWVGIQVRNHKLPIKTLEAKVSGAFVAIPRQDYNYFVADKGLGVGPYDLRITSTTGQVVTETGIKLGDATVVTGTQQFP